MSATFTEPKRTLFSPARRSKASFVPSRSAASFSAAPRRWTFLLLAETTPVSRGVVIGESLGNQIVVGVARFHHHRVAPFPEMLDVVV
jgi:hypothetical protein